MISAVLFIAKEVSSFTLFILVEGWSNRFRSVCGYDDGAHGKLSRRYEKSDLLYYHYFYCYYYYYDIDSIVIFIVIMITIIIIIIILLLLLLLFIIIIIINIML